jgi:hypothetical protein
MKYFGVEAVHDLSSWDDFYWKQGKQDIVNVYVYVLGGVSLEIQIGTTQMGGEWTYW